MGQVALLDLVLARQFDAVGRVGGQMLGRTANRSVWLTIWYGATVSA
jgi:hypothetical protein